MVIFKFGSKFLTKKYLYSKEYEELMETFLADDTNRYNLGKDLDMYKNFGFRANNMQCMYAWKWLCVYQYRDITADLVFSDKVGIDFGGGCGPIGGKSRIIDILPECDKIDDVEDNSLDYIFSSHTLEHVSNLDETLIKLYNKLKPDGVMVIFVPCYKCVRWISGNINRHLWTFSLEDDKFTRIDKKIKKAGFRIKKAEYCWDNSIFVLCEK